MYKNFPQALGSINTKLINVLINPTFHNKYIKNFKKCTYLY